MDLIAKRANPYIRTETDAKDVETFARLQRLCKEIEDGGTVTLDETKVVIRATTGSVSYKYPEKDGGIDWLVKKLEAIPGKIKKKSLTKVIHKRYIAFFIVCTECIRDGGCVEVDTIAHKLIVTCGVYRAECTLTPNPYDTHRDTFTSIVVSLCNLSMAVNRGEYTGGTKLFFVDKKVDKELVGASRRVENKRLMMLAKRLKTV